MRYRVAKHKRGFVCVIYEPSGNRRRIALKAADKFAATAEAAELVGHIEQRKPRQRLTVGQIVEMYLEQSEAIWKEVDRHHSKPILAAFGLLGATDADSISERRLRDFSASHKGKPGTIRKELSILRAALNWGVGKSRLDPAVIERMGLKRAKRLGEVGARGGGTDSSPRIGTPEPFRNLLISIARTARMSEAA